MKILLFAADSAKSVHVKEAFCIEDKTGKRWVISMMMDLKMIQAMPEDTRKSAEKVMAAMKGMMVAASTGDL